MDLTEKRTIEPEDQAPVIWITGLSGAGKTTLAHLLKSRLAADGQRVEVLDGDELRGIVCNGLGYTRADREENVRRIVWLCELLARNGVIPIVAAISPYRESRAAARRRFSRFLEVYLECPLEVLVQRDPKGLYREALAGRLPHFTGVSDPYEAPEAPEVRLDTSSQAPDEAARRVIQVLHATPPIPPSLPNSPGAY